MFPTQASAFELLSVDEISVDTWKTLYRRDPFQYEYTDKWNKGAQFNLNLRLFENFSWKNHIHMDGTDSQLQNAGWEFEVVMDKFCIQPFYYHHSEHALDGKGSEDPGRAASYPLIDRMGFRFVFLGKKCSV